MILTCHLLAGAAVASRISNPFLALPMALLSHYFLDSLPQEEYSIENIRQRRWNQSFFDFVKVCLDILSGILIIYFFSDKNPVIFTGAFLAIIPDSITLLSVIFPMNKLLILHQKFHEAINHICGHNENKKIPFFWGVLSQITVISISIFLL